MNSTPTSKANQLPDAPVPRTDERLAHAYGQITRAGEELARVSKRVAKMEHDAERPPSAGPPSGRISPAITTWKAGAPGAHRLGAGGVHRCRYPGFAVDLWSRGQASCRPLGPAVRFNIAVGKSAGTRPAGAIYRSSGRGRRNTTASNAVASDRTARGHADNYCSAS